MQESVNLISAFAAGFLSFVSPCVLPLVPVYISTVTGLSVDQLSQSKGKEVGYIFSCAVAFCIGLDLVFIALGLTATVIGQFLTDHLQTVEVVSGVLLIAFGVLIATHQFAMLAGWFARFIPTPKL